MIQIDWSKAPEGATHFAPADNSKSLRACWYMQDEEGLYFIPCDIQWSEHNIWQPSKKVRNDLLARPITTWTGKGLPPVGESCETRFTDIEGSSWRGVIILARGARRIFLRENSGDEFAQRIDECEFRPFRTPEQIAAEDRGRAIREMQSLFGGGSAVTTHIFETLHNAGYRKFEIVEE